jgi:hypothetical protein
MPYGLQIQELGCSIYWVVVANIQYTAVEYVARTLITGFAGSIEPDSAASRSGNRHASLLFAFGTQNLGKGAE